MPCAIALLTVWNFSSVHQAVFRELNGLAGGHICGRVGLDEQRKQRHYDSSSKARKEKCSMHLAEVKHVCSQTNKYQEQSRPREARQMRAKRPRAS